MKRSNIAKVKRICDDLDSYEGKLKTLENWFKPSSVDLVTPNAYELTLPEEIGTQVISTLKEYYENTISKLETELETL